MNKKGLKLTVKVVTKTKCFQMINAKVKQEILRKGIRKYKTTIKCSLN